MANYKYEYANTTDLKNQYGYSQRNIYRLLETFRGLVLKGKFPPKSVIKPGHWRIDKGAFADFIEHRVEYENNIRVPKYRRGEW